MKKYPLIPSRLTLLIVSVLFFSLHQSKAQSTSCDSLFAGKNVPVLEKLVWLAGANVAFAGFDYVGFNLTKRNPSSLIAYRVCQVLFQTGMSWLLYKKLGLPTVIGFNLIWWTFGDDFLYYCYAEAFNPGAPWESRGSLRDNVMRNHATWAYWTPLGIMRGMKRSQPIAGDALLAQSLIGLSLAVTLTISF
jgi:hypothetical protein